jgi:hypothetical protein
MNHGAPAVVVAVAALGGLQLLGLDNSKVFGVYKWYCLDNPTKQVGHGCGANTPQAARHLRPTSPASGHAGEEFGEAAEVV